MQRPDSSSVTMPSGLRRLIAILPVVAVSALGGMATRPNIPVWYAELVKPDFTPPSWIFAPVWTVLYAMMAYAAWRLLGLPSEVPAARFARLAFAVQLLLNLAWSLVFFGAHSPGGGMVVIVLLMVAIMATIRIAWPLDKIAALVLVPYALWVAFASVLNAAIWWLNG